MSMENPLWVTGTLDTSGSGVDLSSVAPHLFAPNPAIIVDQPYEAPVAVVDEVVEDTEGDAAVREATGSDEDPGLVAAVTEPEVVGAEGATIVVGENPEPVVTVTGGTEPVEPVVEEAKAEPVEAYDPADHTVSEVLTHLESADEAEKARVLAAEADGRGRKTILGA